MSVFEPLSERRKLFCQMLNFVPTRSASCRFPFRTARAKAFRENRTREGCLPKLAAMRKIIHIDMDAFYASVEQRDFPQLRGKPVAVGRAEARSVVAAASYEARKYGVRSAMPSLQALRLCPHLHFQPPRFAVYRSVSGQIHSIFREYADLVEPLSLDEAYLDVTRDKKGIGSATLIALEIKKRIREATGLTASAGVSFNKFLAKMASDYRKPDGIFVVEPEKAADFISALPIGKFYGIGGVTAGKFREMGVLTGADLKSLSREFLVSRFGKAGIYFYDIARGIDERPVEPGRERKSYSVENTYAQDIKSRFALIAELYHLEKRLARHLEEEGVKARTVVLKVRYHDFSTFSRSRTFQVPVHDFASLHESVRSVREAFPWDYGKGIRLLGVGVQHLLKEAVSDAGPIRQLSLF